MTDDTMNEAGATGWMLAFASATVEHRCGRLREDYNHVKEEGTSLALMRHRGEPMSEAQARRLDELASRMARIVEQMGGAQRSLLQAADKLGLLKAPDCPCERCVQERAVLGNALVTYWDLDRPRQPWSFTGSI